MLEEENIPFPLKLIECPRDAMQGWKTIIPTEKKIEYINALLKVGFDTIDFGSLVSAKAIPQMADTKEVVGKLDLHNTSTKLLAIVANSRGAEEAAAFEQITYLGFPFSISETFQQRNTNSSIDQSLGRVEDLLTICSNNNKLPVIYISMGFGNPYGDPYSEEVVMHWVNKIAAMGVKIISLADTVGLATPEQVLSITDHVIKNLPDQEIGVHLHSSPYNWKEKVDAALKAGCRRFDGALKGIGGCPMANDELVGNMDSELMIPYFQSLKLLPALNEKALKRKHATRCTNIYLMDFQIPISLKLLPTPISYSDKILLVGSCFTEHIGGRLQELKFSVLQNPNGILFDPASVCSSISSYLEKKEYKANDLFYRDELWQSWQHHSRFSGVDQRSVLDTINHSQHEAAEFIREANWLIITLGSSFSYCLKTGEAPIEGSGTSGEVANCHRAPGQWFQKYLMEIEETFSLLNKTIQQLSQENPDLKIIFTISPVRHIRDGVIENNRSKARLIEAVHQLVNLHEHVYYFPAYELVIDVLRDYRFYDIDLVHPNYPATEFVFEKFTESCIDDAAKQLIPEIKRIANAYKHKAFQPNTMAHRQFLQSSLEKAIQLQQQFPFLDLKEEIAYFSKK